MKATKIIIFIINGIFLRVCHLQFATWRESKVEKGKWKLKASKGVAMLLHSRVTCDIQVRHDWLLKDNRQCPTMLLRHDRHEFRAYVYELYVQSAK